MCSIKFWPGDSRNHPEVHRVPGGRAAKRFHQTVLGHRPCQPPQGQGPPLSPSSLWGGERLTILWNISAKTACLLKFSVFIAFRSILSNFSPPTPLSRTQVWIDVNFLLGCYWLLDMIWARRSNTSENSVSFSITTFSCLNYAEPIFLQEFDIRKVRLKVFGVKYHSSAQQAHRPRQTQLTKYYF